MVIRFIIRIFTYITTIICPSKVSFNINKCTITNNANECSSDDNSDNEIDFAELDENNNITVYPFKKSQSYTINRYYCGFCAGNIQYPQHMYNDKVYCSISCRNYQFKCDEKSNNTIKHHSFSI